MPYEYRLIDLVNAVKALQVQLEMSGYTLRQAAMFLVKLYPDADGGFIHMQVVLPKK